MQHHPAAITVATTATTAAGMPRIPEPTQALQDIDAAITSKTCAYVLALLMEANKVLEEHIQDLLVVQDVIASYRYLSAQVVMVVMRHISVNTSILHSLHFSVCIEHHFC